MKNTLSELRAKWLSLLLLLALFFMAGISVHQWQTIRTQRQLIFKLYKDAWGHQSVAASSGPQRG